jgi:hypothetical protein
MSFEGDVKALCGAIEEAVAPVSSYHAGLAVTLAGAIDNPATAQLTYNSPEWWGGAGSMADLLVQEEQQPHYLRLLSELVRTFEAAGFHSVRAVRWAELFEEWLRTDVCNQVRKAQ